MVYEKQYTTMTGYQQGYQQVIWKVIILGVVTIYSSEAVDRCNKSCPPGYYCIARSHAGVCYQFVLKEETWATAKRECNKNGAQLMEILNLSTMNWVKRVLTNELSWRKNGVWIGASDHVRDHHWVWPSGKTLRSTFSYWASGNPSTFFLTHGINDCAALRRSDGWKWRDYPCSSPLHTYRFICQYDMPPPPPTTTTTRKPTTTTKKPTTTTEKPTTTRKSTTLKSIVKTIILETVSPSTNKNVTLPNSTKSQPNVKTISSVLIHVKGTAIIKVDPNFTSTQGPNEVIQIIGASKRDSSSPSSSNSNGLVIGTAFGIIALLVAVVIVLVILLRKRRKQTRENLDNIYNVQYQSNGPHYVQIDQREEGAVFAIGGHLEKNNLGNKILNTPNSATGVQFYEFEAVPQRKVPEVALPPTPPNVCHPSKQRANNQYVSTPRNSNSSENIACLDNSDDENIEENIYWEPSDVNSAVENTGLLKPSDAKGGNWKGTDILVENPYMEPVQTSPYLPRRNEKN